MSLYTIRSVLGVELYKADGESLRAVVEAAAKSRADLAGANLAGAYLTRANLAGANLAGANLADANLTRAYLAGAYLTRATGIHPTRCTSLLLLKHQPGKIRMFKLVNRKGVGPFNGGITYEVGQSYSVDDAETDDTKQCGAGINLADLPWCMSNWQKGYRILVAEFTAEDIAAIPIATDGKFRVHRCKIVDELDLAEIGLVEAVAAEGEG